MPSSSTGNGEHLISLDDLRKSKVWKRRDVAAYFKVSMATIDTWIKKRGMPYFRSDEDSSLILFYELRVLLWFYESQESLDVETNGSVDME